jgi:hypothetical protein
MWIVPRDDAPWTVLLNARTNRFHTQRPDTTDRVAAVTVAPGSVARTEVLTWSFPEVTSTGTTLQMAWDTTLLSLRIGVEPSRPVARAGRSLAPYVGTYRVTFEADSGQAPYEDTVELFDQNGVLRGRFGQTWPGMDPEFDLIPDGEHFTSRYYQNGRVYEEDRETVVVFLMDKGRATGFELRFEDTAYAKGERVQ